MSMNKPFKASASYNLTNNWSSYYILPGERNVEETWASSAMWKTLGKSPKHACDNLTQEASFHFNLWNRLTLT